MNDDELRPNVLGVIFLFLAAAGVFGYVLARIVF